MTIDQVQPDNATIVAFFGPKERAFSQFLDRVQRCIRNALGSDFLSRPLADIHSTIIGLDVGVDRDVTRDVPGVVNFVQTALRASPLTIQYGGYDPNDLRMLSRGQSHYRRSLTLDGSKAVLIGWPVHMDANSEGKTTTMQLGEIRQRCERFGFRHKYHVGTSVLDTDSYLVIGDISASVSREGKADAASLVRETALEDAFFVTLDGDKASLVEYRDTALPYETSTSWRLKDVVL